MYVRLTIAGSIEGTLYQMLFHRRTGSLRILVEEQQSLRQLSVVQTLSLQHIGGYGLVLTFGDQGLDTLALVLLAGGIQCLVEGELLDGVEVLLLEVGGRHVVVGIDEGKHVLEHTTGGT